MKRLLLLLSVQLLLAFAPAAAQDARPAEEKCEGTVYRANEVSRKAVIKETPDPGMTEEGRAAGVNGVVRLAATLCHTGRVTDIHVLNGLPYGLNELAVKAARRVKFKPAEKDGRQVSMYVKFEFGFAAPDAPAPEANNGRVEEVVIHGNRRHTDEEIARHLKTRPGARYTLKQTQRDLQTLHDLSLFDREQTRFDIEKGARGGVVVVFTVFELPIISDLTFKGLRGVTEADVLKAWQVRGVRYCKECPYDRATAAAATEAVRALMVARGWPNATVDARVDVLSAFTVALTFVVFPEGQ